jgi:uracil-DNA glycosylase family 4
VSKADDLHALLAEAREHLAWELAVGAVGVPVVEAKLLARPQSQPLSQGGEGGPSAQLREAPRPPAPASQVPARPASQPARPPQAPAPSERPVARAQLAAAGGDAPLGLAPEARRVRLAQLAQEASGCTRCELAKGRTHSVFARGNPDSPLMFIGEGPGQEEDRTGFPFVGPAGQLLDKMVAAMGFARDDVYICNVVKCRPPGNRTPLPSEAGACAPFLAGQLEAIAPRVIVALGRCAAENLGLVEGGGWRGRWGAFRGIPVMPTYHPAFLLRSPEFKRPVWEDLQKVMARLKVG